LISPGIAMGRRAELEDIPGDMIPYASSNESELSFPK
jgi:hypothetical protein